MKAKLPFPTIDRGFSLVELLVAISALVILLGLASHVISDSRSAASLAKLENDVRTINAAVDVYKVFGGSLDSASSPGEVLTKLRSRATSSSAERLAGLSGSMIDRSLRAEVLKAAQFPSGTPRAIWNRSSHRFEIVFHDADGVKRFYQDDELASVAVSEEFRETGLQLAEHSGWIWDYKEEGASSYLSPTGVTVGPGGGSPPEVTGGTPPVAQQTLLPPAFSIPGGQSSIKDYNLSLRLKNPNDASVSRILFSVDGGEWKPYAGSIIEVFPGAAVRAYSESIHRGWRNSREKVNRYEASPATLLMPRIESDVSQLDYDTNRKALITISDLNNPKHSTLEFRVNEGEWKSYGKPFYVSVFDYWKTGARLEARAMARADYWEDSDVADHFVESGVPRQLEAPIVTLSSEGFTSGGSTGVSIVNPNPDGVSEIAFLLTPVPSPIGCAIISGEMPPEGFLEYAAPFSVSGNEFQMGFAVIAYVKSKHPSYIDSNFAVKYAQGLLSGLRGGHFDVDTSSYLAEINGGGTDGHVHAYDEKFDVSLIDFFNLLGGKLHNITQDIPDPNTFFKLIVVNADLSPDAKILINQHVTAAGVPVTSYDDTPISETPVYSLGGVAGTQRLDSLAIYFDQNATVNAGIIPTNTGDVRGNVPGRNGEWRNGALTVQAVRCNEDGSEAFSTDPALSAGGHGAARSGLLWEATVFWHWKGDSYHKPGNPYRPSDPETVSPFLEGGDKEPVCDH